MTTDWVTFNPPSMSVHARDLLLVLRRLDVIQENVRVFPFHIDEAKCRRVDDHIQIRISSAGLRPAKIDPEDLLPGGLQVDYAKLGANGHWLRRDRHGHNVWLVAELPIVGW